MPGNARRDIGAAARLGLGTVAARPRLEALERALIAERAGAAAGADGAPDSQRARPQRRAQGAFFTPAPLVAFVVEQGLGRWLARADITCDRDGVPGVRVLDPCAGDGRFLAAAGRFIHAWMRARDPAAARAVGLDAIARRCLVGIERDPDFAELARARTGATIHRCEALCEGPAELLGAADVVLGNPPYLRSIHLARTDPALHAALRQRFAATSYGEWDLYGAFLEQALRWCAPAGEIALVAPTRWLTAAFAAPLRALLAGGQHVRAIVDFGAAQVFPDATTYTGVTLLSAAPSAQVAIARRRRGGWQHGAIAAAELGAAPWQLSVGQRRRLLDDLRQQAPALADVARIAKGTGTNADSVFVIERAARVGDLVVGDNKLAGPVRIEAEVCRPCYRGRDVRAWGRGDAARAFCMFPYHRDGRLLTPDELAAWPRLAAHLASFRAHLEARERGRFAGPEYYRFGRPQNLAYLCDVAPKVVIPDVAQGGRALIDRRGALVLDSAYAVRPIAPASGSQGEGDERGERGPETDALDEYPLALLVAVLNAPIVRLWLEETGVPLRGRYLRLKTAYLSSLPLPPLCAEDTRRAARIAAQLATATEAATEVTTGATSGATTGAATDDGDSARAIDALVAALDEHLRCAYQVPLADWRPQPRAPAMSALAG